MKRRQLIGNTAIGATIGATSATALGACGQTNQNAGTKANRLPNVRGRMATSWP